MTQDFSTRLRQAFTMTRLFALAVIAIVGLCYLALPPRARSLATGPATVSPPRGAIHIHTQRSDGSGTVDEVAAAAERAGLKFIILTDHGDATREPDRPVYRHSVLCIDAVEVSTDGGHVVALDLRQAPYRLGGEPRDVIQDLRRLGAFTIAAHPGSRKPALRWTDWTPLIDGLEWLNGDSEWRDEKWYALARVLFAYPFRHPEALATLLDRPTDVLRRWDELTVRRRVIGVAAGDAHARLGVRNAEAYETTASLHLPGYESVFRTFSITLPQLSLTGDAAADARAVLAELRGGHVYSSIDALATPAVLSFSATSGRNQAEGGDVLRPDGNVALNVHTNAPDGSRVTLLRNGAAVRVTGESRLDYMAPGEPATFRVEVYLPGSIGTSIPWIVSNPIYVGERSIDDEPLIRAVATQFSSRYDNGQAEEWTIEKSPASAATLDRVGAVGGTQLSMRYALGGTVSDGAYAAVVMPAGSDVSQYDRLTFSAYADKPMRVSIQLRSSAGERWHRSVYIDQVARPVTVFFDDMTPSGATRTRTPALANTTAVLFVIDSVNTRLGTNGRLWLDDVKYAR